MTRPRVLTLIHDIWDSEDIYQVARALISAQHKSFDSKTIRQHEYCRLMYEKAFGDLEKLVKGEDRNEK